MAWVLSVVRWFIHCGPTHHTNCGPQITADSRQGDVDNRGVESTHKGTQPGYYQGFMFVSGKIFHRDILRSYNTLI